MTIICAICRDGETWVGSDTQWTVDREKHFGQPKFIVGDGFALGTNGSGAYATLLASHAKEIDTAWSAHDLWCWATNLFSDFGANPEEKPGSPPWWDCSFIWVRPGKIMDICATGGCCGEMKFVAKGSGDEYAMGAAFVLLDSPTRLPGDAILRTSIRAAMHYSTTCGGEVWVRRLGEK